MPPARHYVRVTSIPGNDDGLEAGHRRDLRGELRRMIDADPMLASLVVRTYPNLHLRSTFAISMATVLVAVLTLNTVLAAVIGLLLLAGHLFVIFLLAHRFERGALVMLGLLRGGCAGLTLLIAGTMLVLPS